ncbi:MAG: sigma-70 family RNA polymerase sigma factor [Aquificales bacterium]|nr:sigma-70 family RNA polymerase sigma factor [Aquificales bacterium]
MVDDQQIVKQAQQGTRSAVAALYHKHHAQVYRYIVYRVGDTVVADDLTADVFVSMVKHIDSYEDRGRPFLAWLYTIAGNVVKMHYRHQKATEFEPLPDEMIDQYANPAEIAQTNMTHEQLIAAMPHLPEMQRQVILLKFIEGFSNREIAAMLGKKEGNIRVLQHRAILTLRQILTEEVQYGAV